MEKSKGQVGKELASREQEREIRYEEKKTFRRRLTDYLVITVASVIYAVAVSFFLDPNSLAPGGVTGIAIILNRVTGLETGTWMFMINIPILVLGMWKFGWKFILSTLYCTAATSFFTNRLASVGAVTADPLLAAVVGGSLMAVSLGLVFKAGATTGGTDIIIKLLRLRFPHLKTGSLFLLTDAVIVTASAFVFQDLDTALYAGLVVFMNSVLLDIVLYGHTHRPVIDIERDLIAVNPGSLTYPRQEGRRPSYAIMDLDREGKAHFTINYL